VVGAGLGGDTARQDCEGSRPHGSDRLLIKPAAMVTRPVPAARGHFAAKARPRRPVTRGPLALPAPASHALVALVPPASRRPNGRLRSEPLSPPAPTRSGAQAGTVGEHHSYDPVRVAPSLPWDRKPSAVLTSVVAGRPAPEVAKVWGQLLWLKPSTSGSPVAHEPPGSLVSGDGVDNPVRIATARRHGQRPSISTSNEKLRNVELQAQQNAAPEHSPDDPVALVPTLAANQRQPSTDKGCRQAHDQRQDPKDLNACGDGVDHLRKTHPVLPRPLNPGSRERSQRSTDLVWRQEH
jgi:hypothetical protein